MSEHTHAVLEVSGNRANVTFRTEAGLNVGSVEFMQELESVVDKLAQDRSARFVVFRAEGKVFLAGANIKAMSGYSPDEARAMGELGHRVLNKIEALPQVTIAAIHGAALGGGCELSMACDFRFAVKRIKIGQPEVLLGLIPGWGGTIRLPRLVPLGMARRMMFSGDSIDGQQASEIGLVDEVVNAAEDLEPRIAAFLDNLIKAGPSAIAQLKESLRTGDELGAFTDCFTAGESKEGMTAFVEKRPASWTQT
jgi:enoyl-CoA hydratase